MILQRLLPDEGRPQPERVGRGDAASENQEEVIGLRVRVPDELALHLDGEHVLVVELSDDPRAARFVERGGLVGQV
jgi:hypothetical protein